MQAVVPVQTPTQTRQFAVSLETAAYVLLILLALTFRLAELDKVPMTVAEAPGALAAWRTVAPQIDLPAAPTDSPAVFFAQRNSFILLGATEFAARILTALAGVGLALSPLLFRSLFGKTRTFMFSLILTFSPVLLLASRFSSGTVWALLFAVCGLWALWRYKETNAHNYGVLAVVLALFTLFFAEPGGLLIGLMLLGAAVIAVVFTFEEDDRQLEIEQGQLRQLPVFTGILFGAGLIVALSTGFMTYPTGLNGVGELVSSFVRGFSTRTFPDAPIFFPLVTSLFYEPILWVFAVAGLIVMVNRREITAVERFLIAWLGLGVMASILYTGADASHALWLTMPLAGLASYTAALLFMDDRSQEMWVDVTPDEDINRLYTPQWGRWLLSIISFALFIMLAMHLQVMGRALLQMDGGIGEMISRFSEPAWANTRVSALWVVITLVFLIVGFFLAGSVWGTQTTLQSLGLGLLGFMLFAGISGGWNAAVFEYTNPAELWHTQATGDETPMLRSMLLDFARRESEGYLEIPVTVVLNEEAGITRDGVVAWQVRDFVKAEFVEDVSGARAKEIVMMIAVQPAVDGQTPTELPDLGGDYVGRNFVILRDWDVRQLRPGDLLSWWFQRRLRVDPQPSQVITLWVRQDIYESQPFNFEAENP